MTDTLLGRAGMLAIAAGGGARWWGGRDDSEPVSEPTFLVPTLATYVATVPAGPRY